MLSILDTVATIIIRSTLPRFDHQHIFVFLRWKAEGFAVWQLLDWTNASWNFLQKAPFAFVFNLSSGLYDDHMQTSL